MGIFLAQEKAQTSLKLEIQGVAHVEKRLMAL